MAVTFADCRVDQVEALRAFLAGMYSPEYVLARDKPFLEWQFGAAPNPLRGGGLDVKLGLVDGQIAGCIGYIPIELNIGPRVVRGAWAANWMVDDRYRRLGLGPLLMRELCSQFDATLALGGNRDAHALLPRMGWTDFGDLHRFVAVVDAAAAAALTEGDSRNWPSAPAGAPDQCVEWVDSFTESATALWDGVHSGTAGTRRTADYLNWRYAQHPLFKYRLVQSINGDALNGLGVYRVETVRDLPVKVGRIVELVCEPEDAGRIVRAIVEDAKAQGVAMLDFFCSTPRLTPALVEAGFSTEAAAHFPMLFQPIDRTRTGVLFMAHLRKCADATLLPEDWYVTTSDGDQDRPN
jgi:GNAT superfamily N-acetyltransferase